MAKRDRIAVLAKLVFADWDDDGDGTVSCEEALANGTSYSYPDIPVEEWGERTATTSTSEAGR